MIKQKIKIAVRFVLNPRFLFCFGLAWLLTNGWSYIAFAIGTWFSITWMIAISGTYMALLWFPFTPEKLITVIIAMALLRWLFPHDQKTLGILRDMHGKIRMSIRQRREKRRSISTPKDSSDSKKEMFDEDRSQ